MRKQIYLGESVRRENDHSPEPLLVCGKFSARTLQGSITAIWCEGDGHPADAGWTWVAPCGSAGGMYDTEEKATQAGVAWAISQGWTEDAATAEAAAIAAVKARHNDHCERSGSYNKHYGPAVV